MRETQGQSVSAHLDTEEEGWDRRSVEGTFRYIVGKSERLVCSEVGMGKEKQSYTAFFSRTFIWGL